jgi:Uma2 family endonuclease
VREYWLVHPVDRIVTVYRLEAGRYGVPEVRELVGRQPAGALPRLEVDWDRFAAPLGA